MTNRNDEANMLCKLLQLFTLQNWASLFSSNNENGKSTNIE